MLKFTAYRAADSGWRIRRNRYFVGTSREVTIGLGLLLGHRAFGVTWRRP